MLIFITGGTRSGKSDFALKQAMEVAGDNNKYFIATCPRIDSEIEQRIAKHQEDRESLGFITVEEELDISGVMNSLQDGSLVLLDCLTLWINNLLYESSLKKNEVNEESIEKKSLQLVKVMQDKGLTLICVSNEVGLGLVPADQASRKYRDLVGKCNRILAESSDKAYLVSCGIPIKLKDSELE